MNKFVFPRLLFVLPAILALVQFPASKLPAKSTAPDSTDSLCFSGFEWEVSAWEGPMGSEFRSENVWVDDQGQLHLKISQDTTTGQWYGAEVASTEHLGFGVYQWQVIGDLDKLDKNVVLGMFNYPGYEQDGTNEIDIEIARWGNDSWDNLNYTVYSNTEAYTSVSQTYSFNLSGTYTTHRFTWEPAQITFQSQHGHWDEDKFFIVPPWTTPANFQSQIPQQPQPVYINLWLFSNQPPADEVEIVISEFKYTDLAGNSHTPICQNN